ncbi:hypothetical protein LOK49_LG10G02590 [Camellia lanceoleosa]|uniref:Uncharacterized protein n=1 Tax=Camellia lanceoleosa TaxID=1840588 RepID=A0ACC0GHJ0_9ERIC|nr:hypothetical protein LOK49_LG10G02590 [Camellia lanceoleosa]
MWFQRIGFRNRPTFQSTEFVKPICKTWGLELYHQHQQKKRQASQKVSLFSPSFFFFFFFFFFFCLSQMAKRLIPSLNRVLVEKIIPPSKTNAGILLPEKTSKLNSGKVVAVGPGIHDRDGKLIPVSVKEGETVLLPEYGGTEIKLGEKEYHLYRDDDILGTLHD